MILSKEKILELLFVVLLLANILTWFYARDMKGRWANVPPAPDVLGATAFALGDRQFAYRAFGVVIQNLGDTGGRSTVFADYDYGELLKWFFLADRLDSRSDFIPFLASYYFGSTKEEAQLRLLLDYLQAAGNRPEGQKWRWLAQGVYLARFQLEDPDRAYEMARVLAAIENEDMPGWTRQMPAFILNNKGKKEAAYDLMIGLLQSSADKMHPNEVNFMRDYICTRILDENEAASHPLCQDIP